MLLFCCRAFVLTAFFGLPVMMAAQPAEPAPQVAAMQQVEDGWDAAVARHDQFALENLLAADFVGIAADGSVTTRNQQIAHLFTPGAEPASLSQKVVGARMLGDIAVVNGTYVMEWKGGGAKVAEKGVFTHIYRQTIAAPGRAGAWQCINSQRTVVATEDERKKAAPRTKSGAALPLHVPLVYSGPKSTEPAPSPGSDTPQR